MAGYLELYLETTIYGTRTPPGPWGYVPEPYADFCEEHCNRVDREDPRRDLDEDGETRYDMPIGEVIDFLEEQLC